MSNIKNYCICAYYTHILAWILNVILVHCTPVSGCIQLNMYTFRILYTCKILRKVESECFVTLHIGIYDYKMGSGGLKAG